MAGLHRSSPPVRARPAPERQKTMARPTAWVGALLLLACASLNMQVRAYDGWVNQWTQSIGHGDWIDTTYTAWWLAACWIASSCRPLACRSMRAKCSSLIPSPPHAHNRHTHVRWRPTTQTAFAAWGDEQATLEYFNVPATQAKGGTIRLQAAYTIHNFADAIDFYCGVRARLSACVGWCGVQSRTKTNVGCTKCTTALPITSSRTPMRRSSRPTSAPLASAFPSSAPPRAGSSGACQRFASGTG